MSLAYKCDKCSRCFDPGELEKGLEYGHVREYVSIKAQPKNYILNQSFSVRVADIHLCPACNDEFKSYILGGFSKEEMK